MKVAFIGHRVIAKTTELVPCLTEEIIKLIKNEGADTFIFGSRSRFNDLCYKVVTEVKYAYPYIKRVFTRAEYEYAGNDYVKYLLTYYEDTFFPDRVRGVGRLSYIKRNEVIVDNCDVLIVYYDSNYKPDKTRSGTRLAVD